MLARWSNTSCRTWCSAGRGPFCTGCGVTTRAGYGSTIVSLGTVTEPSHKTAMSLGAVTVLSHITATSQGTVTVLSHITATSQGTVTMLSHNTATS